jgi:glycosyltransferase involved in cell wall biosynthesis
MSPFPAVVFRRELLPYSEGFIANQAAALTRYAPVLVGTRRSDQQLPLKVIDSRVVAPARLAKVAELGLLHGFAPRGLRALLSDAAVVHAHFGPDATLLLRTLARPQYARLPFVVTFHGYDATVTDDGLRALGRLPSRFVDARRELFDRADVVIAVSDFVSQHLIAAGADPAKVIVRFIGVDTGFFCPPRRNRVPAPSALFVGRLHAKKGARDLLEAVAILAAQGISVPCTIVGEGSERESLVMFAERHRLEVQFLGALDPAHIRDQLHNARVLCAPSVTAANGDAEGFGLVFAEAQACGVPVVSYRSGGVPEAVRDGETGLLAAERDVAGLAVRLRTLIADDDLWRRMSAAARDRVVSRFDLHRQTAELENVYDAAVAARAG